MAKKEKQVLLNNLFNGTYIEDRIGGEIINMYQADNGKYYVYANPYGHIASDKDNTIEHILFIRSAGNGAVKVLAKAVGLKQILLKAKYKSKDAHLESDILVYDAGKEYQRGVELKLVEELEEYIDEKGITYGGVPLYEIGGRPRYYFCFEAEEICLAKEDIYLSAEDLQGAEGENGKSISKINNQSQKLYLAESKNKKAYTQAKALIDDDSLWEPAQKVDLSKPCKKKESLLSIIRKEDDEQVNSNLLAHFLEHKAEFWEAFASEILGIKELSVLKSKPRVIRESFHNIDLLIEVGNYAIVIENKIKSGINGKRAERKGYSQLAKYYDVVEKEYTDYQRLYFLLRPNYNKEDYSKFTNAEDYVEIHYSQILDILTRLYPKVEGECYILREFRLLCEKQAKEFDNALFEIMNCRFMDIIKAKQK